jgi:hypothetical protein
MPHPLDRLSCPPCIILEATPDSERNSQNLHWAGCGAAPSTSSTVSRIPTAAAPATSVVPQILSGGGSDAAGRNRSIPHRASGRRSTSSTISPVLADPAERPIPLNSRVRWPANAHSQPTPQPSIRVLAVNGQTMRSFWMNLNASPRRPPPNKSLNIEILCSSPSFGGRVEGML